MNSLRRMIAVFLLLHAGSLCVDAGEVIDRIAASVNRQAILESELRFSMAYQCLLSQTPCDLEDVAQRQAMLERLIDQKLIEQQMQQAQLSAGDGAQDLGAIRKQVMGTASEEVWEATLHRYGLTEPEVVAEAARQAGVLRFIESRFRANVHVEQRDIEHYYGEVLVPQLRTSDSPEPSLPEVADRIREILTQQEINKQLAAWLQNLREQGRIQIR